MSGSFSASLSGLNANQQKLSVIGNNLANINTVGFKASTVVFSDLVSQSIGGTSANPTQIGLGVATGSISPNFSQGGVETTGVATNAAIQGNGFFVVGDTAHRSYSRAGNFSFDADGLLVTADGQPVQGYTAIDPLTGNLITTGPPSNIVVPPGGLRAPVPTTLVSHMTNLSATTVVGGVFVASPEIFDALGTSHVTTTTFTSTGPGTWDYDITVPGAEVTGGTPGTPFSIGSGNVEFDGSGKLLNVNGAAAADVTVTSPTWANGATPTDFIWDIVDVNGVASMTGYSVPSATSAISQNGSSAGTVDSISINGSGQIVASFGLGRLLNVGQLSLAGFNNPQGLIKLGANRFAESEASGSPSVGVAGTGGRGTLIGGALEQSNVDIAQEFTQMILAQRGYQANSKSITVADELMQETLNMKR